MIKKVKVYLRRWPVWFGSSQRSVKMSERVNACPAAAAAVAHVRLMSVLTTVGKSCFYVLRLRYTTRAHSPAHGDSGLQIYHRTESHIYRQEKGCTKP